MSLAERHPVPKARTTERRTGTTTRGPARRACQAPDFIAGSFDERA